MSENIIIKKTEILSEDYNTLKRLTLEVETRDGKKEEQIREVYQKDSGATILLYNKEKQSVILTKQFRIPIYLNEKGQHDGLAIEACAGLLEGLSPKETAIKETLEETGYSISDPEYVFEAYMVPGTVTEKVYFFIAPYDSTNKVAEGGGLASEGEEIEVLEMPFEEAYQKVFTGEITDGKTIMLLQHLKIAFFDL